VIDHGRIETDFAATFVCPGGGGGNFEIGPLPSVGYPIAADGTVGRTRGTQSAWGGRFGGRGDAGEVARVVLLALDHDELHGAAHLVVRRQAAASGGVEAQAAMPPTRSAMSARPARASRLQAIADR
jgi:hypothetical protein